VVGESRLLALLEIDVLLDLIGLSPEGRCRSGLLKLERGRRPLSWTDARVRT